MTDEKLSPEVERRLGELLLAMSLGQDIKGTTLTVREAAEFANRLPVDDHLSSVHSDIQKLEERGEVIRLDAGTRKYRVAGEPLLHKALERYRAVKHDPETTQ